MLRDRDVVATQLIDVLPGEATSVAANSAPAGSEISIIFTGPAPESDSIHLAPVGGNYERYVSTRFGNPARMTLPDTPGAFELRYMLNDSLEMTSIPITITPAK